ncbi:hypothetical protein BJX96DRAFT_131253 [Aspergillus floccosus]
MIILVNVLIATGIPTMTIWTGWEIRISLEPALMSVTIANGSEGKREARKWSNGCTQFSCLQPAHFSDAQEPTHSWRDFLQYGQSYGTRRKYNTVYCIKQLSRAQISSLGKHALD